MLEDHADFPANLPQLFFIQPCQLCAVDGHRPFRGPLQQVDAPYQRGLSSAGKSDDAENFSLFNI